MWTCRHGSMVFTLARSARNAAIKLAIFVVGARFSNLDIFCVCTRESRHCRHLNECICKQNCKSHFSIYFFFSLPTSSSSSASESWADNPLSCGVKSAEHIEGKYGKASSRLNTITTTAVQFGNLWRRSRRGLIP